MTVDASLAASLKIEPGPGTRWEYGPVAFDGELKEYTTKLDPYLRAVAAVERKILDPDEISQRLRLMYYTTRLGGAGKLFDLVLDTEADRAERPLTTADVPQETLDALVATGMIEMPPSPSGVARPLVDVSHVWVLADALRNGFGYLAHGLELTAASNSVPFALEGLLNWTGDLASAWIGFNDKRLCARADALATGGTWTEDPTALAQPLAWLDSAIATRSPADDLLGDMDAFALRQGVAAIRSGDITPFASLLASYYFPPSGPPPPDPTDRNRLHSDNRFHLFVRGALPPIPHSVGAKGTVTLAPDAETEIMGIVLAVVLVILTWTRVKNVPRRDVARKILGPALLALYDTGAQRRAMTTSIGADLTSPWGAAMFGELATRLTDFLTAGLSGDGWTIGTWPRRVPALESDFGGHALQIGDRDSSGRYGGVSGTPAGYVHQLQATLSSLGFGVVGTPDGDFGPRTAMAVRELQIEASQDRIHVRPLGPAGPFARWTIRRYRGVVNGVVNADTAQTLAHWRQPRTDLASCFDPGGPGAGVVGIVNSMGVDSRAAPPPNPGAVQKPGLWLADDETDTSRWIYAVDQLERYPIPVTESIGADPGLAALGTYVVTHDGTGAVVEAGPSLEVGAVWGTTTITFGNFVPVPLDRTTANLSLYRVVRAVAEVECVGHFESFNARDAARLEAGVFHWALGAVGVGELAAFLAFYKSYDAAAYYADFGRFGIEPEQSWDPAVWQSGDAAGQSKFEGSLGMYGLRDATGKVYADELRPLRDRTSSAGSLLDDYLVDHLRSWRSLHRLAMAQRLSEPLHHAQWEFATMRLRDVVARLWTDDPGPNIPVVAGGATAAMGDIFTSEQAVAVLLRWHVNRPVRVFDQHGALNEVRQAYLNVFGPGRVDVSAETEPTRTQDQHDLVQNLVNLAPIEQGFRTSIERARDYRDPETQPLGDAAGSFVGLTP
jgi:hypothetical protein